MKSLDSIPTGKLQRAGKLLKTGAQIGANYVKYYGDRITDSKEVAQQKLDEENASDIYDSLKELKGSALKVAQVLSMDKNVLPKAYVDKFSLAQFQVPPLSAALVNRTFRKYFGCFPNELFDEFDPEARFAASIGQVHWAKKEGKELAVKIQYPGVRESIKSDLALVKPVALKLLNLKAKESEMYFAEVESKLFEETDYLNELRQSQKIAADCVDLEGISFPSYYPEWSSERVITMDWMNGVHLSEFAAQHAGSDKANAVGQLLWDSYMYQMHILRKVHADPHPGNFLVTPNDELILLDFGCMKEIPPDFYTPYFELATGKVLNDPTAFRDKLFELEILKSTDSEKDKEFFVAMFHELLSVLTSPFRAEVFDFSDQAFFEKITELGEKYSKDKSLRSKSANRGSRHFIYLNRTFFGLYNLLNELGADKIQIHKGLGKI